MKVKEKIDTAGMVLEVLASRLQSERAYVDTEYDGVLESKIKYAIADALVDIGNTLQEILDSEYDYFKSEYNDI